MAQEKYTEKVEKQIRETVGQFEAGMIDVVKKLCVESFKNGVDVGQNRKRPEADESNAAVKQVDV